MKTKSVRRVLSFIDFEVSGNLRLKPRLRKRVYPLFELTQPVSISQYSATRIRRSGASATLEQDQSELAASKRGRNLPKPGDWSHNRNRCQAFPGFPRRRKPEDPSQTLSAAQDRAPLSLSSAERKGRIASLRRGCIRRVEQRSPGRLKRRDLPARLDHELRRNEPRFEALSSFDRLHASLMRSHTTRIRRFDRPSGTSAADGSPSDTHRQVPRIACTNRDDPRLIAIRAPLPSSHPSGRRASPV